VQVSVVECYLEVAEKTTDPAFCKDVGDKAYRDGCYYRVAKAAKDAAVCGRINDDDYRTRCFNELS
jgi:hypothetical protein